MLRILAPLVVAASLIATSSLAGAPQQPPPTDNGLANGVNAFLLAPLARDLLLIDTSLAVCTDHKKQDDYLVYAFVVGIDGGNGKDTISGGSEFSVDASAGLSVETLQPDRQGNIEVAVLSAATGIQGGNGKDLIKNQSDFTVEAHSLLEEGADVAQADASKVYEVGLDAGNGKDVVEGSGAFDIGASSTLDGGSASLDLAQGQQGDVTISVLSASRGIEGGNGKDTIENDASFSISSEAKINALTVTVAAQDHAVSHVAVTGQAYAVGIDGGSAKNTITQSGAVTVEATSAVDASVELSVSDGAQVDAEALSKAVAVGIDVGHVKSPVVNKGTMVVTSDASLTNSGMAIQWVDSGEAGASYQASAAATGILGTDGKDDLGNEGTLEVNAVSSVLSKSFTLSALEWLWNAEDTGGLHGRAEATGIDAGAGKDFYLYNSGVVDVSAEASLDSYGLSISGARFSQYHIPRETEAVAVGIVTGERENTVLNTGALAVRADATMNSYGLEITALAVPGDFDPGIDLTKPLEYLDYIPFDINLNIDTTPDFNQLFGIPEREASSPNLATALATGIETGEGGDVVTSSGSLSATANAAAFSLDATLALVNMGSTDVPTEATAQAAGVSAGTGDDLVVTSGTLDVTTSANVSGVNLSVSGVEIPLAGTQASYTATALSVGVDTGDGDDAAQNSATLTVGATASTSFGGIQANLVNAGVFDTPLAADAAALGMVGGLGDDALSNSGMLTVSSDASSIAWGGTLSLVDAGLLAQGDESTRATAVSSGISGSAGVDNVTNSGTVDVSALALAVHENASIALLGSARIDANAEAQAHAVGLELGEGAETVVNTGNVTASSDAHSGALILGLSTKHVPLVSTLGDLLFEGYNELSVVSRASAIGIDGGEGQLTLENGGDIAANALSTANHLGAKVEVSIASAKTTDKKPGGAGGATGDKPGIFSKVKGAFGVITDVARTGYKLYKIYDAIANSEEVDPDEAFADASVQAHSYAVGVMSDEENAYDDAISSTGDITASALSEASSTVVQFTVQVAEKTSGAKNAKVDASSGALAGAVGVSTGLGDDFVQSSGDIDATATSLNFTNSFAVVVKKAVAGAAPTGFGGTTTWAEASTVSIAQALGVDLGEGSDTLVLDGDADATALVVADSIGASVLVKQPSFIDVGVAFSDTSTTGVAAASGVAAGAGDDAILTAADSHVGASADTVANSASVSVAVESDVTGLSVSGALARAATTALSGAQGLAAGEGDDLAVNRGAVEANAVSAANAASVAVDVKGAVKGLSAGVTFTDSSTRAVSSAVGIDGAEGDDALYNDKSGSIVSGAYADAAAEAVSVGVTGDTSGVSLQGALSFAAVEADADAAGLLGGEGDDEILSLGTVDVTAEAGGASIGAAVDVVGNVKGVAADVPFTDTSTTTWADAVGLDGGAGADTLHNGGTMNVSAISVATAGQGAVTVIGNTNGVSLQSALAFSAVDADSSAVGMQSGEGDQPVASEGEIHADAWSFAMNAAASVAVTGQLNGLSASAPLTDTSASADARAVGIDGAVVASVTSLSPVTALSNAHAGTLSGAVSVTGEGNGVQLSTALNFSAVDALAEAVGIKGGYGGDAVFNDGYSAADAISSASSAALSLAVQGQVNGVAASAPFADNSATSEGSALLYDTGAGDDVIASETDATLHANADAVSNAVTASVNVQGEANGLTLGGAINLSSAEATTDAAVAELGGGADTLANAGGAQAAAVSVANALGVGVSVQGQVNGAAVNAPFVDSSSTAKADAAGFSAGEGEDWLENATGSSLTVASSATGVSTGLSVGFQGQSNGLTLGGALSFAAAEAEAEAVAVEGGDGGDTLIQNGSATVDAVGVSQNLSASVQVAGGTNGVGAGVAFTDNSSTASAGASGLAGGEGDDLIAVGEEGSLDVDADAVALAEGFTVGVQGQTNGVSLGGALNLTAAAADAHAVGIDGGGGDDQALNDGLVDVYAAASGDNLTAAVSVQGSVNGVAAGAPFSVTSADSQAWALGIAGGAGNDQLVNADTGSVKAETVAVTTGTSLAVMVQGSTNGVAVGGTFSDTSVGGAAASAALEGGDGDDALWNEGVAQAKVVTVANNFSLGVTVQGQVNGVGAGGPFALNSTSAQGRALGIGGGAGGDVVVNRSSGTVEADANVVSLIEEFAVNVQAQANGVTLGGSLTLSDNEGTAEAVGIDAGDADDEVLNEGAVTADADAVGNTLRASVGVVGQVNGVSGNAPFSDTSTTMTATATGLGGGAGGDELVNAAQAEVKALSGTVALSEEIGVAVTGQVNGVAANTVVSFSDVTGSASSTAVEGGDGDDLLLNQGDAQAAADATGHTFAADVAVVGQLNGVAANAPFSSNAVTANTEAEGLSGGAGDDTAQNGQNATLLARAHAIALAEEANVSVTGQVNGVAANSSLSFGAVTADSDARGLDGGDGGDSLWNEGRAEASSTAFANNLAVTVAVIGQVNGVSANVPFTDTSARSDATTAGAAGGAGDDTLGNGAEGDVIASATATALTEVLTVTVEGYTNGVQLGGSLLFADATALAGSAGLSGGAGADAILNEGGVDVDAGATTNSLAAALSVQGVVLGVSAAMPFTSASAEADALALGLDGGDDGDVLVNSSSGSIDAHADSGAFAESVALTIKGADIGVSLAGAAALSTSDAAAFATAVEGGAGGDELLNEGYARADADAGANSASVSLTLQGGQVGVGAKASFSDTSTLAAATAEGLSGGDGKDTVVNAGEGEVIADADAWAAAESVSVSVSLTGAGVSVGGALSLAGTESQARAAGISGGANDDALLNEGSADVDATSEATSVSVSVAGDLGSMGLKANAALSDTSAVSTADATGMDGGDGDDIVVNTGILTVDSDSTAHAASVSVTASIPIGITVGASLTKSSTEANAHSSGISGGEGYDKIASGSSIDVGANATAVSTAVSVELSQLGAALADASAKTAAEAVGISAGDGGSCVNNEGTITSDAVSGTVSTSVGFNISGAAIVDASATVGATAGGLSGGADADTLANAGSITSTALSTSGGTSVGITLVGYTSADSSQSDAARAYGIQGGDGEDILLNTGTLSATGGAFASLTSVSAQLAGYASSEGSLAAIAEGSGMAGGDGGGYLGNEGSIIAQATAGVGSTNVAANLAGATSSNASSTSTARAEGIRGGSGGDAVVNTGTIDSDAVSAVTLQTVTFTLAGSASSSGVVNASAEASGILAGGGGDAVLSEGAISAVADADLTIASNSDAVFGASGAGASNSGAAATARGIDAGQGNSGDDWVENHSTVDLTAKANLLLSGSSFTFGGVSGAGGTLSANTFALGLATGDGQDFLRSEGAVTGLAESVMSLTSGSSAAFGASSSGGGASGALSGIVGVDSGAGDDYLETLSQIDVAATSTMTQTGSSFTFGGVSGANSSLSASASSFGVSAGEGSDYLNNGGSVFSEAVSALTLNGNSNAAFGVSGLGGRSGSYAEAVGVDLGDQDNQLETTGVIDAHARSDMAQQGYSFSFGGTSGAGGVLLSSATASSVRSGSGKDLLYGGGAIASEAEANLTVTGSSSTGFGISSMGGISGAAAKALGMETGLGDDWIYLLETADLSATADAEVSQSGLSFCFGGQTAGAGVLAATTAAVGVEAGDGQDAVRNEGSIDVWARSEISVSGKSTTIFGVSGAGSPVASTADGVGIGLGDGDDALLNLGAVVVDAAASTSSKQASYTGIGSAGANAAATGTATAIGLSGGVGDDWIKNEGAVEANAKAYMSTDGGSANYVIGGAKNSVISEAAALAKGIDGGSENDALANAGSGTITVTALADSGAITDAEAGFLVGKATTSATARSTASAYGMDGGEGDNSIVNEGVIDVTARAVAGALSYAGGANVINGDGWALADVYPTVRAYGIAAGDGDNQILNSGEIRSRATTSTIKSVLTETEVCEQSWVTQCHEVSTEQGTVTVCEDVLVETCQTVTINEADQPTRAGANGNGLDGDGKGFANSTLNAQAYGIKVGDGDNLIHNTGSVEVSLRPESDLAVSADGDAFGDAYGRSEIAATATAIGVAAGDGDNWFLNDGTIDVELTLASDGTIQVSDGDICIYFLWWKWCGGADSYTFDNYSLQATSAGIWAGDGDNVVVNNGTIDVSSEVGHNVSVTGAAPGHSPAVVTAEAIGIRTGSGSDIIVQNGSILTHRNADGAQSAGIAVSSGAGDDVVTLGSGSYSEGNVELGSGSDTLNLVGTPALTGIAHGGADSDLDEVYLYGEGFFDGSKLEAFDGGVKVGSGVFTVPNLPTMDRLSVLEGTLVIDGDYQFAPSGSYLTVVGPDVNCGLLTITGEALLGGRLEILRKKGAFIGDTSYQVLQTGHLDGVFAQVTLPDTPLLDFSSVLAEDGLRIEVAVGSFSEVASTSAERTIAGVLQRLLPSAEGEVSDALGEIQGLGAGQFEEAFNSLNPSNYDKYSRKTLEVSRASSDALLDRTAALRAASRSFASSPSPALFQDGPQAVREGRANVWGASLRSADKLQRLFAQDAGYPSSLDGVVFGLDNLLGNRLALGAAFSHSLLGMDSSTVEGAADVESFNSAMYASWFSQTAYVDLAASYGTHSFDNRRSVEIGAMSGAVASQHDSTAYGALVESGLELPVGGAVIRPYASVEYHRLDEEGFAEEGGWSLRVNVEDRRTETLTSAFGFRNQGKFTLGSLDLLAKASFAWSREFELGDRGITASFAAAPGESFTVEPESVAGGKLTTAAGLQLGAPSGFKASVDYSARFGGAGGDHLITGELRYDF